MSAANSSFLSSLGASSFCADEALTAIRPQTASAATAAASPDSNQTRLMRESLIGRSSVEQFRNTPLSVRERHERAAHAVSGLPRPLTPCAARVEASGHFL